MQEPRMVPRSAIVEGVPFVGWGEAPVLEHSMGVHANSSIPACLLMILKYWSDEPTRSAPPKDEFEYPPNWDQWQHNSGNATGLDEIKVKTPAGLEIGQERRKRNERRGLTTKDCPTSCDGRVACSHLRSSAD